MSSASKLQQKLEVLRSEIDRVGLQSELVALDSKKEFDDKIAELHGKVMMASGRTTALENQSAETIQDLHEEIEKTCVYVEKELNELKERYLKDASPEV